MTFPRDTEAMVQMVIPQMTAPESAYWDQPPADAILVDDRHALMTRETLERLLEYSRSDPSGVYVGKMWRRELYQLGERSPVSGVRARERTGHWLLCWFDEHPEPGKCVRRERPVLII